MDGCQRHPRLYEVKQKYKDQNFSFSNEGLPNLQNQLKSLGSSKSVHETDIATKVLKEIWIFFHFFFVNYFNNVIHSSSFPNHLIVANITLVRKKDSQKDKKDFLTVIVLILCPVLFNMFLCDLSFINDDLDVALYVNDNTPIHTGKISKQGFGKTWKCIQKYISMVL